MFRRGSYVDRQSDNSRGRDLARDPASPGAGRGQRRVLVSPSGPAPGVFPYLAARRFRILKHSRTPNFASARWDPFAFVRFASGRGCSRIRAGASSARKFSGPSGRSCSTIARGRGEAPRHCFGCCYRWAVAATAVGLHELRNQPPEVSFAKRDARDHRTIPCRPTERWSRSSGPRRGRSSAGPVQRILVQTRPARRKKGAALVKLDSERSARESSGRASADQPGAGRSGSLSTGGRRHGSAPKLPVDSIAQKLDWRIAQKELRQRWTGCKPNRPRPIMKWRRRRRGGPGPAADPLVGAEARARWWLRTDRSAAQARLRGRQVGCSAGRRADREERDSRAASPEPCTSST